jgi:hypothetical protein
MVVKNIPWESRVTNALPSWQDLPLAAKEGIRALYQPLAIRDTAFLEENGRCMDNIIMGPSTIPQAGRGAFATRFLARDSIITGSPLLIILDRSYLHMYHSKTNAKGKHVRDTTRLMGHQLLLNYCYGHQDSNLLLIPYASGVNYINHNQTKANVKIQWTPDGIISHNASYFELDINDMKGEYKTLLSIDYIAQRDINPGEELFLDYGDEFEKAWNNHVKKWKPPKHSKFYADAHTFNAKMKDSILRTQGEQEIDPYPRNLAMHCHPNLRKNDWREAIERNDIAWRIDKKGIRCDILSRSKLKEGKFSYVVQFEQDAIRDGVPRSAIHFVDKPYTTDFHLEGVFRHEIGIPDEIFPKRWKNKVVAEDHEDDNNDNEDDDDDEDVDDE